MEIDFPATPAVGDLFSANDRTYIYGGWAWELTFNVAPHAASHAPGGADAVAPDARWDLFAPAIPTAIAGTRGNTSVALTWTAGAGSTGPAVTDYSLQYSSDSGTTWTAFARAASATASGTVTGLTNGTAYVFRVAGVNGVGVSAYSSASSAVTPATTPGVPTSLSGTATAAQIALTWTAPASDGGSAITNYSVRYTPSGGSPTTVSVGSATASYTLTGLTNGTVYAVDVAAVNEVGTGSYTGTVSGTPYAAPGAPTSATATAGDTQASLSWTAPSSNGGSAITDYTVQYSSDSGANWTTFARAASASASAVVTGLTNGTAYILRVGAINAPVGIGAWSASSNAVTPNSGGDPPVYLCSTYNYGNGANDGMWFAKNPVLGWSAGDPTSALHDDRIAKGPATLILSGFLNTTMNGTVTLQYNAAYQASNIIGWSGTQGEYNVNCFITKGFGYTYGAEWSTAPGYYGIVQPVGYNAGTPVTAWRITIELPSPPYPTNFDDYEAMDAYYNWSYSPHPSASIMIPCVYEPANGSATAKLALYHQMYTLAGHRSGDVWYDGPKISPSVTNYTEPLLAATQTVINEYQAGFLYAIKEITVSGNTVMKYFDQGTDITGGRACGGADAFDWGYGTVGVNAIGSATRCVRLTLPDSACRNT